MLKSPYLFAISVLVALVQWTGVARAQTLNMGLSFDLPPVQVQATIPASPPISPPRTEIALAPTAMAPDSVAPTAMALGTAKLRSVALAPVGLAPVDLADSALSAVEQTETELDDVALTFATDTVSIEGITTTAVNSAPDPVSPLGKVVSFHTTDDALSNALSLDDWIFENGTHSLVARTVGSAEGTRRADGKRTQAYYGHTDPGNGVWNLGTFSYQHEATSPEDADERQLRRLKRQGVELEEQAKQRGIALSLEEKLNGLDLANQAPLAALDKGGYIDRLAQAKRLQMEEEEAILWARTHAYIDPNTRRWNAPGLGNNVHSISADQERRMVAISSAMKAYSPQGLSLASLDHLEQISLANAGVISSATLTTDQEHHQPLFESADTDKEILTALSDLEISFGLPPAQSGETTEVPARVIAESTIAGSTTVTPEVNSDTEQSIPDIGVAFSPTSNITGTVAIAPSTVSENDTAKDDTANNESVDHEQLEANTPEPASLFTLNSDPEDSAEAQRNTTESSLRAVTTDPESPAETIPSNERALPPLTAPAAESNPTQDAIPPKTTEPISTSEIEPQASTDSAVTDSTATDSAAQLKTLLAGLNTTADPEVLATLNSREQSEDSNHTRYFFRTEDKIIREK